MFLKLSNVIINTRHITKIVIVPNQYRRIHLNVQSYQVSGWFGFGTGSISSDEFGEEFIICAKDSPSDYKIVSTWADKLPQYN